MKLNENAFTMVIPFVFTIATLYCRLVAVEWNLILILFLMNLVTGRLNFVVCVKWICKGVII